MLSQYPQSAFQGVLRGALGGSAAVCDPNPPRPFARSRLEIGINHLTKGRFRRRVVLANVPSFRSLVPGNIRMYLRSVFWYQGTSECALVPSFVPGNIRQNHPFGKPPFCEPPNLIDKLFDRKARKGHSCAFEHFQKLMLRKLGLHKEGTNQ